MDHSDFIIYVALWKSQLVSNVFKDPLPHRDAFSVIFLPARPASQTHDSHKGRMILNHVNPAGRIKNCGEKSAFKNLQLSFCTFFYLRTVS